MNTKKNLKTAIGKTIRVFTERQTPPCPPNGYVGILVAFEDNQITVNCKFGYTQQDKVLSFEREDCKITKILIEESQRTIYE